MDSFTKSHFAFFLREATKLIKEMEYVLTTGFQQIFDEQETELDVKTGWVWYWLDEHNLTLLINGFIS